MVDVWFYHLERSSLTQVLPFLLERSLERGWRVVVQASGPERVEALDGALWTYDDASFLPHGTTRDGDPAAQPVYLTDGIENPNGAAARVLVDGADPGPALADAGGAYERLMVLFDGNNQDELSTARELWGKLKDEGHAVAYWRQDEEGRWAKRA